MQLPISCDRYGGLSIHPSALVLVVTAAAAAAALNYSNIARAWPTSASVIVQFCPIFLHTLTFFLLSFAPLTHQTWPREAKRTYRMHGRWECYSHPFSFSLTVFGTFFHNFTQKQTAIGREQSGKPRTTSLGPRFGVILFHFLINSIKIIAIIQFVLARWKSLSRFSMVFFASVPQHRWVFLVFWRKRYVKRKTNARSIPFSGRGEKRTLFSEFETAVVFFYLNGLTVHFSHAVSVLGCFLSETSATYHQCLKISNDF